MDNESRENWRARRGAPQSPPDLARPNQSTTSSRLSQTGTSWCFDLAGQSGQRAPPCDPAPRPARQLGFSTGCTPGQLRTSASLVFFFSALFLAVCNESIIPHPSIILLLFQARLTSPGHPIKILEGPVRPPEGDRSGLT